MNPEQEYISRLLKNLNLDNEKTLLNKLFGNNANDIQNYNSTVNELIIGNKLKEMGFSIQYERNFNGLKPDWYIKKDNHHFIIDVKSLNATKKDFEKHEFEDKILKSIRSIGKNIQVKISFEKEYFEYKSFDIESNKIAFVNWLKKNGKINNVYRYNELKIEILKTSTNFDNIGIYLQGGGIDLDERRIFSSEAIDKAIKYERIINELGIPFVLAIVNDPINGLDKNDVHKLLYGSESCDENMDSVYSEIGGLFHNQQYNRLISGVIWYEKNINEMVYFHNFFHKKEIQTIFNE